MIVLSEERGRRTSSYLRPSRVCACVKLTTAVWLVVDLTVACQARPPISWQESLGQTERGTATWLPVGGRLVRGGPGLVLGEAVGGRGWGVVLSGLGLAACPLPAAGPESPRAYGSIAELSAAS